MQWRVRACTVQASPAGDLLPCLQDLDPWATGLHHTLLLLTDLADAVWLSHAGPPLHTLQSQMPRLYSNQNGSPNKLNEGGTAITVWITVSDAFVPQIKNIAEVRHPHFSCLSSEIAHCTLKHRKVIWSVFLQKWPRPNLSRALSTEIVGNWTGSVRNTFPLEYVSVIPNEPRPQLYLMFSGFLSEFALWVHCGGFNLFCQRGKYVFVSFNRKCGPKRFFL